MSSGLGITLRLPFEQLEHGRDPSQGLVEAIDPLLLQGSGIGRLRTLIAGY
jgi:hypothetical protein